MKKNKNFRNSNDLWNEDNNLSAQDRVTSVLSKYSQTKESIDNEIDKVYNFKVIMLGDVAVGKTAIINRFVDNTFTDNYKCTIQTTFRKSQINIDRKSTIEMKIWDTTGEEKYRSLTRQYYRNSNGIILIFDLTNYDSFNSLPSWLSDIKKYGSKDYDIILVGNKSDLDLHAIPNQEIQLFAERENVTYLEVSAKNGTNVLLLFERLSDKMIKTINETNNESKQNSKSLSFNDEEMKRCSKAEQQLQQMIEREKERKKCC